MSPSQDPAAKSPPARRGRLALPAPSLLALALVACAVAPPMPDPGPDHPASPEAPEVARPEPSRTLAGGRPSPDDTASPAQHPPRAPKPTGGHR